MQGFPSSKTVHRTVFEFTPFERLRIKGISPSAEGDQGAPPLDPASAQVGAGPALDTLADFYRFVRYSAFSSSEYPIPLDAFITTFAPTELSFFRRYDMYTHTTFISASES